MNRREFLTLTAGSLAAVYGYGQTNQRPPNVLWIMMDDARPDALSCYGRPWASTPNMDAIARSGVRFETAVTQCPICVPSRSSMKTSKYCHQFGLMSMGAPPDELPPYGSPRLDAHKNLLTLWAVAGIPPTNVGKQHAYVKDWRKMGDPPPHASQRTDFGKRYPPVNLTTHGWQIGGTTETCPDDTRTALITELAIQTLEDLAATDAPFFLRASFHAPHVPIQVPPSFMVDPESVELPYPAQKELDSKPRFEREQLQIYAGTLDLTREAIQVARGTYYGMVKLVDHEVGKLISVLEDKGLLDNTVVVINSDHGLQLGEHGLHKKRNFYEQTINSPLVFSWPGKLPQGRVIREQIEMTDFAPTLMDLCGLPTPDNIEGRSLKPLMEGQASTGRKACFAEIDHSGSMYDELRKNSGRRVMVRTKDWKLEYFKDPRVADKDGALYNLGAGAEETENLYNDQDSKAVIAELEALVDEWDKVKYEG